MLALAGAVCACSTQKIEKQNDDENAKISEARVKLGESFTENLPLYSPVVIRFRNGQN